MDWCCQRDAGDCYVLGPVLRQRGGSATGSFPRHEDHPAQEEALEPSWDKENVRGEQKQLLVLLVEEIKGSR